MEINFNRCRSTVGYTVLIHRGKHFFLKKVCYFKINYTEKGKKLTKKMKFYKTSVVNFFSFHN